MTIPQGLAPGDPEYQRLAREEIQHYSDMFLGEDVKPSARETLFQPVPPSWVEMEMRARALIIQKTGFEVTAHCIKLLRASNGVKMLSLGSGPGGIELGLARHAGDSRIVCFDLNPDLMRLGRERAAEQGLNVEFEAADLNVVTLPKNEFDIVFCHASLHHVLELERIADQIRRTLRPGGKLVTVDVCTPNGYLMWPETRPVVRNLFRTLPRRFRLNHTAYAEPAVDDEIWEMDTSAASMECIRAQDIIPVLSKTFQVEIFVPYFSICRRFLDTMYGPNFELGQPLDDALMNWIWQLDRHYLETNQLKPETFFGIYSV